MMINNKLSRSVGVLALVGGLALGLLAGCGQKGPLSLPKDPAKSAKPVAMPAPAASAPL